MGTSIAVLYNVFSLLLFTSIKTTQTTDRNQNTSALKCTDLFIDITNMEFSQDDYSQRNYNLSYI